MTKPWEEEWEVIPWTGVTIWKGVNILKAKGVRIFGRLDTDSEARARLAAHPRTNSLSIDG